MNPSDLLTQLQSLGLTVKTGQGGSLIVNPKALMTPELSALIRQHKAALVEALTPPPDPADVREYYEERAAILEFDAGMARPQAEAEALQFAAVRFGLVDGQGGGYLIAKGATLAQLLGELTARYGDRLAFTQPDQP